ncbi:hypothetical protein HELRODRAFT_170832 [Helobdella robusta]|uniref:Uncharacterized protein n=1 Tax=Helobdella robusta TaxID=6412 RepID=T1F3H5_HELRO|nr:hypothetical protein HELRODRAFT_170832 [Helobdella robusta]ESO06810.1 hypothetical protein HELRODRAFT_170832 [Helobdella robusta]
MATEFHLSPNKQGIICSGNPHKNACGQKGTPEFGVPVSTLFLKNLNFDLYGLNSWQCDSGKPPKSSSSSSRSLAPYTIKGTYYNAYVKIATCQPPQISPAHCKIR